MPRNYCSRLGAAAAVVIAVLVSACTAGSPATSQPAPAASSTPAGAAPGPPPVTIAGYYAQRLSWQPCDKGFECARLYVPFDYSRPAGPRFSLPVVKLPAADPASRVGALVINPGGPGGSGVEYALGARSGEFTQQVLNRFEHRRLRPARRRRQPARGALHDRPAARHLLRGQRRPGQRRAARDRHLREQAVRGGVRPQRRRPAAVHGHGERGEGHGRAARRAGRKRPHVPGKSYGTYLGASYAQQFPTKVRALVLDGAPSTPKRAACGST